MNTPTPSVRLLVTAAATALALTGCAGGSTESQGLPTADQLDESAADCDDDVVDCDDTIEESGDQSLEEQGVTGGASDPATASCLAGDEDCIDESNGGGDVTRPILLADSPTGATAIEPGTSSGASGAPVSNAHLLDDTTLELTFDGGTCDVLEDVLVMESDTEVRIMVLAGQSAETEMCTAEVTQWSTTITLEAPLGDRALLDLAG